MRQPMKHVLDVQKARKVLKERGIRTKGLDESIVLTLALFVQRGKGEGSGLWGVEAETMPALKSLGLPGVDEGVEGLPTIVEHRGKRLMERWMKTHGELVERGVGEGEVGKVEDWLQFCAGVHTRSFTAPVGDGIGFAIIPGIDWCNHDFESPSGDLDWAMEGDQVRVTTQRAIKAGEELTISYGEDLSCRDCLETYGFLPSPTKGLVGTIELHHVDPSIAPILLAYGANMEEEAEGGAEEVVEVDISTRDHHISMLGEVASVLGMSALDLLQANPSPPAPPSLPPTCLLALERSIWEEVCAKLAEEKE